MKIDSILCVDNVSTLKDISLRWKSVEEKEFLNSEELVNVDEKFDVVIFPIGVEEICRDKARKFLIAVGEEKDLLKSGYNLSKKIFTNRVLGIKSLWKIGDFNWSGNFSFTLDWNLLQKSYEELDLMFHKTLSAHVVVHNEIDWIGFCLLSLVYGLVEEIVVVDTESTDGTWEVIQKFEEWSKFKAGRVKIKTYRVPNDSKDFWKIRNFAIEKCTGDWLLLVDGDEVYSKVSLDRIKCLTTLNPFDANCYRFPDYQITYGWKSRDPIGLKRGYDRLYKNYINYNWRGSWPDEHPYIGDMQSHIKALHTQNIYYCHFARWKSWESHMSRWECHSNKLRKTLLEDELNRVKESIVKIVNFESHTSVDFPKEMIPEVFDMKVLETTIWTKFGIKVDEFWDCYTRKKPWLPKRLKLPENILQE